MKHYFLTAIGASVLVISGVAVSEAGVWSAIKGSTLPPKEPTAAYRVEVPGYDVRFYEFQMEGDPNVTCVIGFAESGPTGTFCSKKDKED